MKRAGDLALKWAAFGIIGGIALSHFACSTDGLETGFSITIQVLVTLFVGVVAAIGGFFYGLASGPKDEG